jgi:hypothetical protein
MKQIDIIKAYNDLETLSTIKDYHAKEQWALYSLRKELRSFIDFYKEQIDALGEKYKEFVDSEGILSGDPYLDYMKEKNELDNLEIEQEIHKISLPIVDGITFLTIESLEDFINFTHE